MEKAVQNKCVYEILEKQRKGYLTHGGGGSWGGEITSDLDFEG